MFDFHIVTQCLIFNFKFSPGVILRSWFRFFVRSLFVCLFLVFIVVVVIVVVAVAVVVVVVCVCVCVLFPPKILAA